MNTDTGEIRRLTEEQFAAALKSGERLAPIEEALMTATQKQQMRVSLHDTRSALGKQLHVSRSKYTPHVGKKQQAKAETIAL